MSRPVTGIAVVAILALGIVGCGAESAASAAVPSSAMVRAGLARIWPAIGRPTLLGSRCDRGRCVIAYEYTPPDGYRRRYTATVPAACSHRCSIRWSRIHIRPSAKRLGLDPGYPVGECVHAIDHALKAPGLVNLKTDPTVETACAGVHHSVYSGPLLAAPGH